MPVKLVEEDKEGLIHRDGERLDRQTFIFNWLLRRYFPEEVERLRGDADKILFTEIHIYADDVPEVKYTTVDEK